MPQFNLRYVYHFDELTWMLGALDLRYYECDIEISKRMDVMDWMRKNLSSEVIVWAGMVTPLFGANGWGDMVSPNGRTCLFAFRNPEDETRFSLEFRSGDSGFVKAVHKDGNAAWHKLTGK